jgi:hypothetical protein
MKRWHRLHAKYALLQRAEMDFTADEINKK